MGQADTLDLITKKMPTGISSLDPVMEGGIPPGSLVLLLGEIGSGSSEFIYTSVLSLSRIMSPNPADESILLPESIRYVTFTKLSDDVKREMVLTFKPDFLGSVDTIRFEDLSQLYFDSTVVPVDWYCKGDIISRLQNRSNRDMLAHLSETLALGKQNSLIVLDSFTDLATQSVGTDRWSDLMAFMRGLQRVSKQWNSTVYLPLTSGIIEQRHEREIADIADAVFLFRWEESSSARRQRVMYFEKFRGLMSHLEDKDLVKFAVRISSSTGFEVSNIRVVV